MDMFENDVKTSKDESIGGERVETPVYSLPNWKSRELSKGCTARENAPADMPFLALTLLILLIGVVMVLSASFASVQTSGGAPAGIFVRQLVFAISGIAIMLIVSRISIKLMSRWAYLLLFASIVMLAAVLAVGLKRNGATRWLGFGGEDSSFQFQPSEIAKLAIILAYAKWICEKGRAKMGTFKYGVAPMTVTSLVIIAFLMQQPHLSASIIIILLTAIMMFAGTVRLRWFALAAISITVVALFIAEKLPEPAAQTDASVSQSAQQTEESESEGGFYNYIFDRIQAWRNPDADPLGDGLQIRQSLNAIGSGGLLGQGLGQSRQKYLYLPEEHNDYIFPIVCEELGFIGAMLILSLYALLITRGFWLALHAKDRYSALVVTGISGLLAIQVFLNVAVVTNLLPATGVPLPLFSYGGTALWIQMLQMGIVLSISRDIPQDTEGAAV